MASPGPTGATRKRPHEEEFKDMASLSPSKTAKVHGYLQALSPIKQSSKGKSKYFTCEVTDGNTYRRAVGFDPKLHQKLSSFYDKKEPVAIGNCQIKESAYSSQLEVIIRNSSDLQRSSLEFAVDVDNLKVDCSDVVTLDELPQLANFERVSVQVKVVTECDASKVKDLTKQEYIIADATGVTKIVTWEDNLGLLQEGLSYKLTGLTVRTFQNEKYLSIGMDGFGISEIDDIGEVYNTTIVVDERKLVNAVFVGVKSLDMFSACYSCAGKVVTVKSFESVPGAIQRKKWLHASSGTQLDWICKMTICLKLSQFFHQYWRIFVVLLLQRHLF